MHPESIADHVWWRWGEDCFNSFFITHKMNFEILELGNWEICFQQENYSILRDSFNLKSISQFPNSTFPNLTPELPLATTLHHYQLLFQVYLLP